MIGDFEPTAVQPFAAAWPLVGKNDGCGEHEPKEDSPETLLEHI